MGYEVDYGMLRDAAAVGVRGAEAAGPVTPGVRDRHDPTADEDPVAALIERERWLREELAGIRPALERTIIEQALAVRDDEQRRDRLVRRIYWEVPSIPVTVIRVAFGVTGQVSEIAGPGPEVGRCADCGTVLRASNRTELTQASGRWTTLQCRPCTDAELARRWGSESFDEWVGDAPLPSEPPFDDWVDDAQAPEDRPFDDEKPPWCPAPGSVGTLAP